MSQVTINSVLVLPASAQARADVRAALVDARLEMVSGLGAERFDLALVDVTTPAGKAAFTELFSSPSVHKIAVVVIVDSLEASTDMVGVAEVVTDASVSHELKARLLRARARAAMNRELLERQHDQEVLLDLTARYAETTDVEALLHAVTRRLAEEMEIDRAALVVIDERQDAGFIVAASDDAALKELRIELKRYPEIREVARTGKPVIVEDAPSHPLLTSVKESVAARGIQNLAALPLAIGGKVLGVLLLRRSSGRGAFRPREIDFLATVAHATAIALRNARLMDSLRGQSARDKTARIAAEEQAKALRRFESYFEAPLRRRGDFRRARLRHFAQPRGVRTARRQRRRSHGPPHQRAHQLGRRRRAARLGARRFARRSAPPGRRARHHVGRQTLDVVSVDCAAQ